MRDSDTEKTGLACQKQFKTSWKSPFYLSECHDIVSLNSHLTKKYMVIIGVNEKEN